MTTDTLSLAPKAPPTKPVPTSRLMSLDALRGFDMFWIVGGELLIHGLYKAWPSGPLHFLDGQMRHKVWEGVAFYDLIFPLFVFIVGVSLVFSLSRTLERDGMLVAVRRIFFRSLVIYVFGLLVYGGISKGWDQVRWLGVLQRIALCYLFGGLLFCMFRLRSLIVICVSLLVGYWALTSLVPIRNFNLETAHLKTLGLTPNSPETRSQFYATTERVRGRFEEGLNLPQHLDFQYLPGFKWDGTSDPEGLLSTLPGIAGCLLGVFAGFLLRNGSVPDQKKVFYLLGAGVVMVAAGLLWGLSFPVIKKIWTSSYILIASGYACLLLAAFYQMVEIWQWRKWCVPFVWIGMNPITIYMIFEILPISELVRRVAGGPIEQAFGKGGELVVAIVTVAGMFALVRFLYAKKLFLRL